LHNLRGCDRNTGHALVRIQSNLVPKGPNVSRYIALIWALSAPFTRFPKHVQHVFDGRLFI